MCINPKLIRNPKYLPNKKNKRTVPVPKDPRVMAVPAKCGKCIECMKQRGQEWKIRLAEEIKTDRTGLFVTLSFSEESLDRIEQDVRSVNSEDVAARAVRLFLERWRKKYGKSVKHWLITELGQKGTERLHIHGLIFTTESHENIKELWGYGNVYIGEYVNEKTINYIIKYCTKTDPQHPEYRSKIMTSKGIGKNGIDRLKRQWMREKEYKNNEKTINRINYRLKSGAKVAMPEYYRRRILTEDESESAWIEMLDAGDRWVLGERVNTNTRKGQEEYLKMVEAAQKINKSMGFGSESLNKKYYAARRSDWLREDWKT